jgi:hypothetical protein
MGVYLMGVYLMGVYLMGVYLVSVHLTGVCPHRCVPHRRIFYRHASLISMRLVGVHVHPRGGVWVFRRTWLSLSVSNQGTNATYFTS